MRDPWVMHVLLVTAFVLEVPEDHETTGERYEYLQRQKYNVLLTCAS